MPDTFIKIATVTVGSGGAATMAFSSIPSTYTDLCLKLAVRTNRASVIDVAMLTINSNTSNGSWLELYGEGSIAASQSGTSAMRGSYVNGNTTTANTFSNSEIYFPNYAGSTNKSYSSDATAENNATGAYVALTAGLWSNTSAITSISLSPLVGTLFNQYSTATLYGISNS
jgi:hypothetical protein